MGQEYALDWLDQMVKELDPQRTKPENLDDYQSMAIVEKTAKEEKRLIRSFKQFVFKNEKTRQIRNSVNHHLSAAVSLMKIADNNLKQIPARANNFRVALESVFSCLHKVSAFIVNRYRYFVDQNISLDLVCVDPRAHDLRKLGNRDVMKYNSELSEIVIRAFSDIFFDHRGGEITMRKYDSLRWLQKTAHIFAQHDAEWEFRKELRLERVMMLILSRK